MNTTKHSSRGITLVELMIAVAVSGILLVGVGAIYGNSKRTYLVDEEFARLQENARFAMKYMVEDIRMAGYVGCAYNNSLDFDCYLNTGGSDYLCSNVTTGIEGYDATGTGSGASFTIAAAPSASSASNWTNSNTTPATAIPTLMYNSTTNKPNLGSDIIVIRHGDDKGIKITQNKDSANFSIDNRGSSVPSTPGTDCHGPTGICEGDILLASDCRKARVFQSSELQNNAGTVRVVHSASGSPGNSPSSWGGASDPTNDFKKGDAEIIKLITAAYFVANNAAGEPSLFRHDGVSATALELVEGVENMQILYGVDTDADGIANRYISANNANFSATNSGPGTPYTSVMSFVSIQISLLMRTKQEIPSRPPQGLSFDMNGTTGMGGNAITNNSDKRLRKVFNTTVKIRNKGL